MELPRELTTVTRTSKTVAIILFVSLPILAFVFGMRYQGVLIDRLKISVTPPPSNDIACTMEAKICPDGSSVGRVPPDCEFSPCPDTNSYEQPPVMGTDEFVCPESDYVDCMPGPIQNSLCAPEFLRWATANCPGFKGAAY